MKTENLQSLLFKYRRSLGLRSVTLELTNRCNLKCIHCLRSKNPDTLSFEKIKEIVLESRGLGTFDFTITGGEPSLHSDFWQILDFISKHEMIITLFTDAVWYDERFIKRLQNYNVASIHISFYSLKKEVYEKIVGEAGVFKKYISNLMYFKKYKLPVKLKTLVMTLNETELPALSHFAEINNFDWQYNYLIFPRNDFSKDVLKYRLSDKSLMKLKSEGYVGHFDPHRTSSEYYICNMGRTLIDISAAGNVYPCIAFRKSVGNVYKSSLSDIWRNSKFLNEIRCLAAPQFECFSCRHNAYCNRCPGLAFAEHGDFLKKPMECCRITSAFWNGVSPWNGVRPRNGVSP